MKYIITKQQYRVICEQSDSRMPFQPETFGYNPKKPQTTKVSTQKQSQFFKTIDPHTVATVAGIGALFIPIIGPFLSAGIGLADAALYAKEGDTKTAGLVAAFALLPAVGSVVSKIPGIKQLGVKGMSALASRLSKGIQITNPVELAVVNGINLNKNLVQSGLNSQVRTLAQQSVSRAVNNATKVELTNLAKNGIKEVGTELATDKAVELIRPRI